MRAPRWALALLKWAAPRDRTEGVLGDLEEAHRARVERRGWAVANVLTGLEALDMALELLRGRVRRWRTAERSTGPTAGSTDDVRAAGRSHPGSGWSTDDGRKGPRISLLDVKLGLRLLVKHPGLTLVGGVAMAFAIALGAAYFETVTDIVDPTLPLPDGDRVVGIRHWNVAEAESALPFARDFLSWRESLESIERLGAFRTVDRNLIVEGAGARPVEVARITASAFRLAGVPPLLGRGLVDADERPGAPPVVVIGHDLWQTRFGGAPGVVGRTVRLGSEDATVVGVMPTGFAFPVNHGIWTPIRLDDQRDERGAMSYVHVFGRLAPGVTLEAAQAELTAIGGRLATTAPDTNQHLRPQVVSYTELFMGGTETSQLLLLIEIVFLMLLVLVCANVATLFYARTAAREGELSIRSALGASRGRIVGQLLIEALVLALLAATVGLLAARWGVGRGMDLFWSALGSPAPFWWDDGLAPTTVFYAGALAVFGALIVAVVPALKATGRQVQMRLRRAAIGGSDLRLGRVWTLAIVAQVAFSVFILSPAITMARSWARTATSDLGLPAEEYLAAQLEINPERTPAGTAATTDPDARFGRTVRALERRLAAEPRVAGVTFADRFPGMNHPRRRIELSGVAARVEPERDRREGSDSTSALTRETRTAFVDPTFFDVLGVPVLAGRAFDPVDAESDARVVIVNEAFVHELLGDRNAIGRRVRYLGGPDEEPGPWYEIVGVARNVAMDRQALDPDVPPGLYLPLRTNRVAPGGEGDDRAIRTAMHVRGDPASFAPRLRRIAADVDPTLRLYEVQPLDRPVALTRMVQILNRLIVSGVALVALIALVISACGIYALMSFTVARRTREIGLRAALGAGPRRIVTTIVSRALAQIGAGVAVGAMMWIALLHVLRNVVLDEMPDDAGLIVLLSITTVLTVVGLLACGVPARRALRIDPTQALKAD